MDWLAIVGDAVWILALSLIAGASRTAWPRIEPDAHVPLPVAAWRASKPVALLLIPVLATLIGLALGYAARTAPHTGSMPLLIFGARVALAPPLVLLQMVYLHRAMTALADEGQLRP